MSGKIFNFAARIFTEDIKKYPKSWLKNSEQNGENRKTIDLLHPLVGAATLERVQSSRPLCVSRFQWVRNVWLNDGTIIIIFRDDSREWPVKLRIIARRIIARVRATQYYRAYIYLDLCLSCRSSETSVELARCRLTAVYRIIIIIIII